MQKTKTFYGYILNDLTTFIWVTPIYDLTRPRLSNQNLW